MWFLILEIWVWLLAAFAFGWISHWLLCCRGKGESNESAEQDTAAQSQQENQ